LRGSLASKSDETAHLASFPYACHLCEVEVDPAPDVFEILRMPRSMIDADITHGLGQALSAYCAYDRDTGRLLSGSADRQGVPVTAVTGRTRGSYADPKGDALRSRRSRSDRIGVRTSCRSRSRS
jgi:CO/xanthine dehydrogenase Mo-binding subunit